MENNNTVVKGPLRVGAYVETLMSGGGTVKKIEKVSPGQYRYLVEFEDYFDFGIGYITEADLVKKKKKITDLWKDR
jgi:hypothetical protein